MYTFRGVFTPEGIRKMECITNKDHMKQSIPKLIFSLHGKIVDFETNL